MEQKRGGINIEKALQTELMTALNEMFYAILCVKPEEDTVLILQSSEHPCSAQQKLSWTEYLGRYSGILTEESYRKVKERFSSEAGAPCLQPKGRTQLHAGCVISKGRKDELAYCFRPGEGTARRQTLHIYFYSSNQ